MKKWERTLVAILAIVLIGSSIFNALSLDNLNRENILLEQRLATLKASTGRDLKAAREEFQDDLGKIQEDLAKLEDNVKNKMEKGELEKSLATFREDVAEKADKQALTELDNKIFKPAEVYDNTRKAAVNISSNGGFGAGFLFKGQTQIVTAYHVVAKTGLGGAVMVIPNDGVHLFIMGKIKKIKPEWDLALIELNEPMNAEPLSPRNDPIFAGEQIVVIGNPGDLNNSVSTGVVSGLRRNFDQFPKIDFIQLDAAAYFGNSGGPIIDRDGRLVGFMSQTLDSSGLIGFNLAVPVNYVQRFLEE